MRQMVFLAVAAVIWAMALGASAARAQDTAWIQVEAQPTLRAAQERARAWAATFADVAGFQLPSGWYAIVLGPQPPARAQTRLAHLRQERLIPDDSHIATAQQLRRQFWPVGGATAPAQAASPAAPAPPLPDEPLAEARRMEAALSLADRQTLQTALHWLGFYNATIDGAFGPGTRDAIARWQAAQGYAPTGVVTTRQRAELTKTYQDDIDALGLELLRDQAAGIEVLIPAKLVQFDRFEPPFVRYGPAHDSGVQVLLISQPGDRQTLATLHDTLQTLEIMPLGGERSFSGTAFTLNARDETRHTHAHAALHDGLIKGYLLTWPAQDDTRMTRALERVKVSFRPFGNRALDDSLGQQTAAQRADLLAGLEIRRPALTGSGFYIDAGGTVLTTAGTVAECRRITIGLDQPARRVLHDPALGIAVLRPETPLAPRIHAAFRTAAPRPQSEVAVAGYSWGDALTLPTLTFGQFAQARGLEGQEALHRLNISTLPGDAGGPVFDTSGAVIGMLLAPDADAQRQLPAGTAFIIPPAPLNAALAKSGINLASAASGTPALAPEDLMARAQDITVLVACWP